MKHVRFTKDYDHPVRYGVDVAYKKGMELGIPEAHYEAAKAKGAVEDIPAPKAKGEKADAGGR